MSDRRYEVYEVIRQGLMVARGRIDSIPDALAEEVAKRVYSARWGPSMSGAHPDSRDYAIARAALSVLFPGEEE